MDIEIKNLNKVFGQDRIYDNFTITFKENSITGLSGPSGIGKTTLLNLCAGLERPDSGSIMGIDLKKISYIFQEDRLLPWRTVLENLELVLKEKDKQKAAEILKIVGLENYTGYYPDALSGGMQKRVSIARAFCYPSETLLMDEPFGNLDQLLKEHLMDAFLKLWKENQKTVIFVSHNIGELEKLCHTIYILKEKPIKIEKIIQI